MNLQEQIYRIQEIMETNESKDKHIDFRVNYIEGAGQLCGKCIEKYEE